MNYIHVKTPFTRVAIVERSLSDEKMARSLNDLSKSTQLSRRSLNDLSMFIQWSPWSPRSQGKRFLNERSTNTQWMLKERSRSAQRSHQSLNDLSAIFQWTPNVSTLKERWLRDQRAHKDFTQKRLLFCIWELVERSGQFLIALLSPSSVRGLLHWCFLNELICCIIY